MSVEPVSPCPPGPVTVTVALIEDHQLVAIGLSAMMAVTRGLRFTGAFGTVSEVLRECEGPAMPEVVLLDLRLADFSDPCANAQRLRAHGCAVIAYTSGEDPYLVRRACKGGVLAIVRKTEGPEVLLATIRAAARGELTPSVDWASALDTDDRFVTRRLTESERRVLALYASGATADYVARRVGLSTNTVNKYVSEIRRKFLDQGRSPDNRVDLFRLAQAEGLLPTLPNDI